MKFESAPFSSTKLAAGTACLALALTAAACDSGENPEGVQAEGEDPEEVIEKIDVKLPPTPDFAEGKAPEKWEDDCYSIYGLRQKVDENLKEGKAGKEIEICGWVQDIYVPPECPEGEFCPPGKQPHVWITDHEDTKGKKRAMMVVNYRFPIADWQMDQWKDVPEVMLEKGKRYRFKGNFVRFSSTGFAHDAGLLEFKFYEVTNEETGEKEWIAPPGAAWHPISVAQQEEQNKELAERAAKAAEDYKNRGK